MKKTELKLQLYGKEILRQRVKEVKEITPEVREYLEGMLKLMRKEGGIGLAANQAGIDLRLVVIETQDKVWKIINPQIRKKRGSIVFEEGCLSFPGLNLKIKRAKEVWVDFLDVDGNKVSVKAEDILAVAFQHEVDHLDGILFIDHISYLERLKISPWLLEIKRKSAES